MSSPMWITTDSSDEEEQEQHEQPEQPRLENLPKEILLNIFEFCTTDSLQAMATMNAEFATLILTSFNLNDKRLHINALPTELLLHIFSFLDRKSLAQASKVNRRFQDVAYDDSLWVNSARLCLVTNTSHESIQNRCRDLPSARDRVRVSRNWLDRRYSETLLLTQEVKYMPRIQLEDRHLWVSWGNRIWAHPRMDQGRVKRTTTRVLKGHNDDVSRFVVKNGIIVSGGRDRALVGWQSETGRFLFAKRNCHQSEISAVDLVTNSGVIVTGSRDKLVKIWSYDASKDNFPALYETIDTADRVWSLEANPMGDCVAIGTAGWGGVPSLHLLDLNTTRPLFPVSQGLKRGAGILDLHWMSNQTFLSCGYDTTARLWDLRTGSWERVWTEPFDEAVYCLATDKNMTLICGTARHGLVRLWDMRQEKPVQMYYTKHPHNGQSSPVYSVAFDPFHLYVALDQSLSLLSFSGLDNNRKGQYRF
ncbi:F-box/WD repeat-containing protein 4-like [Tigriopus californicus]|uniref:F-box/WD repeat-containing protein 4-like n=1 Tax=Tigriopus californicus TaxID=6832 RepID=UPI0027DA1267|nr:F-box/WD repeat-containing protein 4-like [Tigriopus californicus]